MTENSDLLHREMKNTYPRLIFSASKSCHDFATFFVSDHEKSQGIIRKTEIIQIFGKYCI